MDTQAIKLEGQQTIAQLTVDETMAAVGLLTPLPQEAANKAVDLFEDGWMNFHGRQDVNGHGTEDMSHQGKALPAREQGGPPGGELALKLADERLQG